METSYKSPGMNAKLIHNKADANSGPRHALTYWDCVMGIYFAWMRVVVLVDRRRLLTARENATGRGDRRSTIDDDEDEDEFARGYDSRRRLATTTTRDGDGGISILISVSCG